MSILLGLAALLLGLAPVLSAGLERQTGSCTTAGADHLILNTLDDLPDGQLRPLTTAHFADPSASISTDEIEAQDFVDTPCTGRFTITPPDGALWLRFSLVNPHEGQVDWVLAFMETIYDEMALYEQTGSGLVLRAQNGRTLPTGEQSNVSVKSGLPITLAAGEEKDLYLRVSGTFAKGATPVLVSADMFDRWTTSFETIVIVLMGLMAMLAILSPILFRHVLAQFYKYYTLYMISAFLFIFIVYGWLHRIFDVQLPVTVIVPVIELVTGMSVIANIQYCRVMLSRGERRFAQETGFVILTGIAIVLCSIAVVNPWRLAMPNHLMLFVSPMILLVLAIRRWGSQPQVPAVCASLICLICGLAISNYFFLSPPPIPETSSVLDVMLTRAGTFTYAFAIIGEAIFMMLAISTMLRTMRTRSLRAVEEVEQLRRTLTVAQEQSAQAKEAADAQIRLIEDVVEDGASEQYLPFEDRFEQRARKIILDNAGNNQFGAKALASELGVSERTLGRKMKEALDMTPAAFIRQTRLNLARDLILLRHHESVAEVAYTAGFSSMSHFAKLYRAEFHEKPSDTFKSIRQIKNAS